MRVNTLPPIPHNVDMTTQKSDVSAGAAVAISAIWLVVYLLICGLPLAGDLFARTGTLAAIQ